MKIILLLTLLSTSVFASSVQNVRHYSYTLNHYIPSLHRSILKNISEKKPLHGRELRLMHEMVSHYINIDTKLKNQSSSSKSLSEKLLLNLDRHQSFLINYMPFYSNKKLRQYLNDEDLTFGIKRHDLTRNILNLIDPKKVKKLKQDIQLILSSGQNDINIIKISSHQALKYIQDLEKVKSLNKIYKRYLRQDLTDDRVVDITDRISGRFGNTAGGIRWRKGHLLKKTKIHKEILDQLLPLDVITEKTYFALTDKLIPGHFGHNAIWLGTKNQLIEIGMWNSDIIKPFHKDIEAGKSILEVDRTGTHLKSLDVFMNVDEFAILRLKEIHSFTNARVEEIYTVALSQLGKIYDFNFDVETTNKLVCSELLYQSFTNVHWPTQLYLKGKLERVTISPDNVVSLALYDDAPIELIYYVAQKEKNQTPYYKDLDALAQDLEFLKVGSKYKRVEKQCSKIDGGVSNCQRVLVDLPYQGHASIPSIKF